MRSDSIARMHRLHRNLSPTVRTAAALGRFVTTSRVCSTLFREFDSSVASALLYDGYAVVDRALSDSSSANKLRHEIDVLREMSGGLGANETHFVTQSSSGDDNDTHKTQRSFRIPKKSIREAELHRLSPQAREKVPHLVQVEQDYGLRALLSVYIPSLTLSGQAIKAQHNAGDGGCFPIHVDSDRGVDNRIVTGVLYLNQDWSTERDGGALRLYPFPKQEPVDIEPRDGRLVLMSATEMHHRVLPSHSPRYAITLWLSGALSKRMHRPTPLCSDENDVGKILLQPRFRRHVARVVLADEWEASLHEAHDDDVVTAAIQSHRAEVAKLRHVLSVEVSKLYKNVSTDVVSNALENASELKTSLASLARRTDPDVQWLA